MHACVCACLCMCVRGGGEDREEERSMREWREAARRDYTMGEREVFHSYSPRRGNIWPDLSVFDFCSTVVLKFEWY